MKIPGTVPKDTHHMFQIIDKELAERNRDQLKEQQRQIRDFGFWVRIQKGGVYLRAEGRSLR